MFYKKKNTLKKSHPMCFLISQDSSHAEYLIALNKTLSVGFHALFEQVIAVLAATRVFHETCPQGKAARSLACLEGGEHGDTSR